MTRGINPTYHVAMSNLLIFDIDQFLARTGLAPTRFGQDALGDKHFVRQIRAGRRVWPETEAKVRKFMAEYPITLPTEAA